MKLQLAKAQLLMGSMRGKAILAFALLALAAIAGGADVNWGP